MLKMLQSLGIIVLSFTVVELTNYTNYTSYKSSQLTQCELSVNASNPCINGICLTNHSRPLGYQCYCLNGFTGINCTTNYDECLHRNPCQNSNAYTFIY